MKAVDRVSHVIVWLWRLTKGWLPQVLGSAATLAGIIWGAYGGGIWDHEHWWWFVAALLLAAASLVAQAVVQRPSYMELRRIQEEAVADSNGKAQAIEQSFEVLLRNLAEDCDMASNSDRASVYYFHQDRFVMLARWSIHPTYALPGRRQYPIGQGAIGQAWDRGSASISLPADRTRWETRLEEAHGFSHEVAAKLAMQCRTISALRITADHHAVGVLVFESIEPSRGGQAAIDVAEESTLFATLSELVGAVAALTPSVEQVSKETATRPGQPEWKLVAR